MNNYCSQNKHTRFQKHFPLTAHSFFSTSQTTNQHAYPSRKDHLHRRTQLPSGGCVPGRALLAPKPDYLGERAMRRGARRAAVLGRVRGRPAG